jgi:hypothetical protein
VNLWFKKEFSFFFSMTSFSTTTMLMSIKRMRIWMDKYLPNKRYTITLNRMRIGIYKCLPNIHTYSKQNKNLDR